MLSPHGKVGLFGGMVNCYYPNRASLESTYVTMRRCGWHIPLTSRPVGTVHPYWEAKSVLCILPGAPICPKRVYQVERVAK